MEPVTRITLQTFLQRLGERYPGTGEFYLLGGSALCLLGNLRTTVDVDYTLDLGVGSVEQFEATVAELAAEMHLHADEVPLAEFIPLPPQAYQRRRLVGRYGQLNVYIFDLYSIALSKIARGFEADLEDVMFMLHKGLISFGELERHFNAVLPDAPQADIIPDEFRGYFEEIRRRFESTPADSGGAASSAASTRQRLKALVVIFEELVPISGGGTPRTFNIVRALAERGHEVYVAASFGMDAAEAQRELGAAGLLPLAGVSRMDPGKMRKYAFTYPLNILRVALYAWRLGPDLILTHNTAAGFAALLGKLLRPRAVTVCDLTDLLFEYLDDYAAYPRGSWLKLAAAGGRWMERTSVRKSDRIITISRAMRYFLVRDYGADAARVEIVHDGVDTRIFHQQEASDLRQKYAPDADHVLIFHGVIDPQDGPELLIEAAPAILEQHPRTRFWLVGDGTAVPDLKARIKAAGLSDRFYFSGWVQQANVARYISASDLGLVILPDVLSARGRVTLKEFEYWACGVPAVLPRLPALQEVGGDEAASLFYTPGDAIDFAAKVNELLSDDTRRRQMGRLGQQRVAEKFEWRALAGEIARLCEGYVSS